ncbi:MAG: protein kinase [Thermaerobacter sp.]|nr:protein kinase [Thermaerobacter sp.]
MVGNVLGGRYEVLERIGTGGMSLVYRARDVTLNRLVAVKILKHQWAEDEEVVRRFDQEARSAASLVNRHVVQVYDVGCDQGDVHYIVMELVAGQTLRVLIDREAPLPYARALDIADQVLAGLEVAHAKKLVHRDIKPQNILVAEDQTVKVTDFGIAYAATSGTLVNTGSLLGTVQYLSPEQARGKMIGHHSDLYSLGVVLFEMLTGRLPFEGDSAIGVAIKHLQDEAPTVISLQPDVPVAVNAVVMRALAKDPAERYQSARGFRQDIERILHPERAPAPDLPVPLANSAAEAEDGGAGGQARAVKKRRWWPWIVLLVLLLLAGGGVYAFQRWLNVPTVSVPNIRGESLSRAKARLASLGLTLNVIGRSPSKSLPKDYILSESPAAGTQVKAGQSVGVVASSGPTLVSIPNLLKQDIFQAKQELSTIGLKALVHQVNNQAAQGLVVRQSPSPAKSVPQGTTVTLWVSNGPPQAAANMPNLEGLTASEAASELIGLNLAVGTPSNQWSTEPANTIIDQSPAPYSSLSGISQVSVVVSNGPSPQSGSLPKNVTVAQWTIPNNAAPKSVLKVVVTDSAGNEEVFYQQVNPGTAVQFPVTWYGNSGQLALYLNGQALPPQTLTPNFSTAPSGGGPGNGTGG